MQQVATQRGPLVWRDMDQEALDNAYDQLVYAPNRDIILGRMRAASDRARENLGAPERVPYGASEYERFDLFRAKTARPPAGLRRSTSSSTAAAGAWVAPPKAHSTPSRS